MKQNLGARREELSKARVLWVHAGGHKTGSTAIQNYLALGGLQKTAPHIFYRMIGELRGPRDMHIGNGQGLLSLIQRENEEMLGPALEEFFGSAGEAIISSENLSFLSLEEWQKLDKVAAAKGIRL